MTNPSGPDRFSSSPARSCFYTFQLANGAKLWRSPHHASDVTTQAEILIAFFIIAIARAWDLVGARDTGFVAGVAGMARGRRDEVGGPRTNDEA